MPQAITVPRLDARVFAQSAGHLDGSAPLAGFPRIVEASQHREPNGLLRWAARGEARAGAAGQQESWLHLDADARVPQVCQRCLGEMEVHLQVARWFRFVDDEATATAQDDTCEEDLLVLSAAFDLHGLIEDELLLELPYITRHDTCPIQPKMSVSDPAFVAEPERPNPFSTLASLKAGKGG